MPFHYKHQLLALLIGTNHFCSFFKELLFHAILNFIEEFTSVWHVFEVIDLAQEFEFKDFPRVVVIESVLFHFDEYVGETVAEVVEHLLLNSGKCAII